MHVWCRINFFIASRTKEAITMPRLEASELHLYALILPTFHFITQGIILLSKSLCVSLLLTVCILEALILLLKLLNL